MYLAVTCSHLTGYHFSNKTINKALAGSGKKRLHIVDYGVQYGCQWPHLLDYLANKQDGGGGPPPAVRMTCVDVPQPGFRPIALIEEPDAVLRNIREMRPDVFIHTVVSGMHSTPFFGTRFREALFYYSAIFEMLDAAAPRDDGRRLVVERDLVGRCALNAIACEGSDRVERPETYRQWQARNRQAGLRQLPLCPETVEFLRENVWRRYPHRDLTIDVDRQWLLQGWKGRTLYAMSTWAAADDDTEFS